MSWSHATPRRRATAVLGMLGALLAPGAARAQTGYQIQPILKSGDAVGEIPIRPTSSFYGLALNDAGHLAFMARDQAGGLPTILYADGKFLPLTVTGGAAPGGGTWAKVGSGAGWELLPSINQSGNLVFTGIVRVNNEDTSRTMLWERQTQKLTAVTLPGMPATSHLTLDRGSIGAINNRGEIAFFAVARDADKKEHWGVFLRRADGSLQPVAIPGQDLPDGRKVSVAYVPSLNDAGVVAFLARRQGDPVPPGAPLPTDAAYLWENGVLSASVQLGTEVAGGQKIAQIWYVHVNNKNRNVLLQAVLDKPYLGPHALYLSAGGSLVPVAVPGQEMPGGGQLKSLLIPGVSTANAMGQHAVLAQITDAGGLQTALYRMESDGSLVLILKSGMSTDMGSVTRVGPSLSFFGSDNTPRSVAMNSEGQIAVPIRIGDGPDLLVLLTPPGP